MVRPAYSQRLAPILRTRPDAVLFDWDNTLFDHDKVLPILAERLIKTLGHEPYPTPAELNAMWFKDKKKCCETYFPGHTPPEVLAAWTSFMKDVPVEHLALLPQAMEVLDGLKRKGIPMIIVSNRDEATLRQQLEHFGLSDYFEVIVAAHADASKRKPNPYPIVEALKEANRKRSTGGGQPLELGNLWYVGDHPDDAGAARSDGLQRFIVGERHHGFIRDRFEDNDPFGGIVYLKNLGELKTFVDNIPSIDRGK